MSLKKVDDSTFNDVVLKSEHPVVVKFWAPWCGPCAAMKPMVEALSIEYAPKVKFVEVNIDDNPMTAKAFGVRSVPTVVCFKRGEEVARATGSVRRASLVKDIDALLAD